MKITKATPNDFKQLYAIGKKTPELKVNDEVFMKPEEFRGCIENPHGLFLVAWHDKKPIGFLYANTRDTDRPRSNVACLVYLAVIPQYRGKGVAQNLMAEMEKQLKARGIHYIYSWANSQSRSIQNFLKKHGMKPGHKFIWMDKRL